MSRGKTKPADPTAAQFSAYRAQYDYFNRVLFGGQLAPVILNFSRASANTLGFFAPKRWARGKDAVHEISLCPAHLALRPPKETASTLVHEMVHAWQEEHGKKGRRGYHNQEWADKMKSIGLQPTATGEPGGPETGDSMTHLIVKGGPFDRAFNAMPTECHLPWTSFEITGEKKKRTPSKVKFTCPGCACNAWGKPTLSLVCGDCSEQMEPAELPVDADDESEAA
jgi:hypothetical protein